MNKFVIVNERVKAKNPVVRTEAQVLASVLQALRHDKRVAWVGRFNSGAMVLGENRDRRYFRANNVPGCSDILGQLRDGRLLAIEVKRPGWSKPRDDREYRQCEFLRMVSDNGGVSGFVCQVEDVWRLLDDVRSIHGVHNEK